MSNQVSAKLAAAEGLLAKAAEAMATANRVSGTLPRVSRESLAEAVTLAQRALALIRRERPDVWDAVVAGGAEESEGAFKKIVAR